MSRSSIAKVKILIVEDEPQIRQVCRRTLNSLEYHIDFANDCAVAEDMLSREDYNLLIIDIRTPVMNGKQFYQHLERRYPKLLDRILFTTGDVISDDTQGFLKQANRPFLLKPFTPDDLRTILRKVLNR